MKKTLLAAVLILITVIIIQNNGQSVTPVSTESIPQIFFIDRRLHRLISIDYPETGSSDKICRKIAKEIIKGKDNNEEILRLIPNKSGVISVYVEKNKAYVDISSDIAGNAEKNPENERLIIYQIVNSMTSVDGVEQVLFTIDGKVEKKFMGFLDMREIFTPNYDI